MSLRQVNLVEQDPSRILSISRIVGNAGAPLDIEPEAIPMNDFPDEDGDEDEAEVLWITDDPLTAGLYPLDRVHDRGSA